MLTIKCAKCGNKIIKYDKIGKGNVLKCFVSHISNWYDIIDNSKTDMICSKCGTVIGERNDTYFKMHRNEFTYSGTKQKH